MKTLSKIFNTACVVIGISATGYGLTDIFKSMNSPETQSIKDKIVAVQPISVDEAKRMSEALDNEKRQSHGWKCMFFGGLLMASGGRSLSRNS